VDYVRFALKMGIAVGILVGVVTESLIAALITIPAVLLGAACIAFYMFFIAFMLAAVQYTIMMSRRAP